MAANSILLKVHGLNTFVNQLGSDLPTGSLSQADNVVITREGIIEPCRGFKIYGNAMGASPSTVAKQLSTYKTRILRHFGTTLQWDNGTGTYTSFSGSYSEPETGLRIKSLESNGNYYFTTSTGVKKLSVLNTSQFSTSTITNSGGVKALDMKLTLNSDAGFFSQESVVAYRVVWGIKDNNTNVILGVPSQREVITNPVSDLLISDFNRLLNELDVVGALAQPDLTDTNYYSTWNLAANSTAQNIQTNMSGLCTKLDADLGGAYFAAIKAVVDAITFSTPPTSGQLISLQTQYDAIVDLLNSYIGAGGPPTITALADPFTTSTQSSTVNLSITIPDSITTSYFYQIYRTAVVTQTSSLSVTDSDFDPGDEMGLVYEANPTSAEITAGFLVVQDITPEAFRGANLYTNPNSGEGISQANEIPPKAKDICLYKTNVFYANTETRYRKSFSLLSISEFIAGSSQLTITDGTTSNTYTFSTTEDVSRYSKTGDLHSSTTVDNIVSTTGLVVGMTVAGTGIPAGTTIATVVGPNSITLSVAATATATGVTLTFQAKKVLISTLDTPSQQVNETARSLVYVINRNDDELVYAYYLSGPTDVPGMILLESRVGGGNAFYANVNQALLSAQFSPNIPLTSDPLPLSFIADNEVAPNRLYFAKTYQPEAVPLLNYFDVGPKDKKILRILALRESLFVFKEEGIYRVSGDSPGYVVNLFDSSVILTAPDTADVLNNQIYLLSSQGVATVSDTGVSIISRPIENLIVKLNTPSYASYSTASFGKAYESDRTYYLWTVTRTTDTVATQCFKYNTFTNSWYRSPTSKTCAVVNSTDDKMYLGAGDTNYIEQERKSFDRTDYADREYSQSIGSSSVSGAEVTLPSVTNVGERDVIVQTQYLTIAQFNRILSKLDMDNAVGDTNYNTLDAVAGDDLRSKLTSLATKLDSDPGVNDTNYAALISAYTSSFVDCQSAFNVIVNKLNADLGVSFTNYPLSSGTTSFESVILAVDSVTATITTDASYPFIQGIITTYAHIACAFTWCPQTMGDPSFLKQVSEGTVLFDRVSFSELVLSFASDLSPGYEPTTFTGTGNGIYGNNTYGENNYGGLGNSIPFRTYVPRNKQRCRYLHCKVEHATARESFAIYGLSLAGNLTSTRAYK